MPVDDRYFIQGIEFAEMEPIYTNFGSLRTGVDQAPSASLFTPIESVIEAWDAVAPVPLDQIPDEAYGFACVPSVVLDVAGLAPVTGGSSPEPADAATFALWDIGWRPGGVTRWVHGNRFDSHVYQLTGSVPFGTDPIAALGASVNSEYIVQDKVAGTGRLFCREPIRVAAEAWNGVGETTDFGYSDPSWNELYARPFRGTNPGFFGFGSYLHHRNMGRPAPHPFSPVAGSTEDARSHYSDSEGNVYDRAGPESGHAWPTRVKWRRYIWYYPSVGVDVTFADFRLITIPYRLVSNATVSTVAAKLEATGYRKHPRRVTSGR